MSFKIPFSLVSLGRGRNWFSLFVEKTPHDFALGSIRVDSMPRDCSSGLLTKRLERLELFMTVAMAMRAYQTIHLFGKFEVLKNSLFKFLAK